MFTSRVWRFLFEVDSGTYKFSSEISQRLWLSLTAIFKRQQQSKNWAALPPDVEAIFAFLLESGIISAMLGEKWLWPCKHFMAMIGMTLGGGFRAV